jgi:mono/diheme cytochrome c family protein
MVMLFFAGCGNKTPGTAASGKDLYDYHCAQCHGASGTGVFIKGVPSLVKSNKSSADILKMIHQGSLKKQGNKMPAVTALGTAQAKRILDFVRQMQQAKTGEK